MSFLYYEKTLLVYFAVAGVLALTVLALFVERAYFLAKNLGSLSPSANWSRFSWFAWLGKISLYFALVGGSAGVLGLFQKVSSGAVTESELKISMLALVFRELRLGGFALAIGAIAIGMYMIFHAIIKIRLHRAEASSTVLPALGAESFLQNLGRLGLYLGLLCSTYKFISIYYFIPYVEGDLYRPAAIEMLRAFEGMFIGSLIAFICVLLAFCCRREETYV